ncbi:MAG: YigZ family protein [Eubacteriales bacterium]|nr:YigZ family protein [Eubacteriales bacterium]
MSGYIVPAEEGSSEYIEKRSSFLGKVCRVESEDEAKAFIASVKKQHRDARHNCWCYIIRGGIERYSDDGEPQGTAGLPMLEILRREGITNVVCVVTRYFGGILLGTGGLFRAYSKAAKDALDAAGREKIVPRALFYVPCPYPIFEKVKTGISELSGIVENADYGELVNLTVSVPEEGSDGFAEKIYDLSNGTISPERVL